MPPTVINLRRERKRRRRAAEKAKADANAGRHGERQGEAALRRLTREGEARRLDGHRLDGDRGDRGDPSGEDGDG
ncbi:MAG: DUF4169 family protein [Pseudomonadota bacterium]